MALSTGPATKKSVYMDYNATTPVDPEVLRQMQPYFHEKFGNPASAGHHWGWTAESAVTKARGQVAQLIHAKPSEVFFTAGATESNNWAVFGMLFKLREEQPSGPLHFITSQVEHSSILRSYEAVRKLGVEVDFLPVNSYGQVDPENIRRALKPHTKLMSFIWVNNEVGSINPVAEIARIAKEKQIYFHTDGTQAVGKIPVNVTELGIDMMSFSGHKIYGPKGVGGFYIRSQNPKVQIDPYMYGGGQEKGQRSGTLNVPGIVGLGAACEIAGQHLVEESARLTQLRQLLWQELQKALPGVRLNGHAEQRSPMNLNITLPGHKTDSFLARLQLLGLSTGSACGTGTMVISHVLTGMGLSSEDVQCSLRLSLGRWTTEEEVLQAVQILSGAINKT